MAFWTCCPGKSLKCLNNKTLTQTYPYQQRNLDVKVSSELFYLFAVGERMESHLGALRTPGSSNRDHS